MSFAESGASKRKRKRRGSERARPEDQVSSRTWDVESDVTQTFDLFYAETRNLQAGSDLSITPEPSSSNVTVPRFEFTSLDPTKFRVFVLHPGVFSDKLIGHITRHNFARPPKYYGLSYVWGQEHAIYSVNVDGSDVPVRPNLFHALQHLRHERENLSIWVDDLCIDQQNETEKTSQVAKMAQIYQNAVGTKIWLGEGNTSSTLAKECIQRLVNGQYAWDGTWWNNHDITAVVELWNRPWFSRGWVIQEVAFSKSATIYCGDWNLTLSHLQQAMDRVCLQLNASPFVDDKDRARIYDAPAVKLMRLIERIFNKSEDGMRILSRCLTLESLVEATCFAETTDRRDSIYAVMSLANDVSDRRQSTTMIVDYSKSDLDVYVDFIEHCVQRSRSLDIICRPWAPSTHRNPLPATIPSWTMTKDYLPFGDPASRSSRRLHGDPLVGSTHRKPYNCSSDRPLQVRISRPALASGENLIMHARGIELGEITRISTRMADSIVYGDTLSILGGIKRDPETPRWTFSDAIWRTLCADRNASGHTAPPSYRSAMEDILESATASSQPFGYIHDQEDTPSIDIEDLLSMPDLFPTHEFLKRIRDTVCNRHAFRSDKRSTGQATGKTIVGLAPRTTKPKDCIFILYGCSVPVVLRDASVSKDQSIWTLVGDAFVDGVMNGEEISHALSEGRLEQIEKEIKIK